MNKYNWQKSDWPHFRYDLTSLDETLFLITEKAGFIRGKLSHLNKGLKHEFLIDIILEEAIKTSKIEDEMINCTDVRSSIINKLGLSKKALPVRDKRAQGITNLIFSVRETFADPLTEAQLFEWHFMLFENHPYVTPLGSWRTSEEPMQIVSGFHGKWKIHFEAPPAPRVPEEMQAFVNWFNESLAKESNTLKFAPVRAAITHLYFESIHPFSDGNGRIGRALAEKALSQGFGYPAMISLSNTIEAHKKEYYSALHSASQSNEITSWIHYFINVILQSQNNVETLINFILQKSQFFLTFKDELNDRQLKVIQRMLQSGVKGFEGGMSAKKYMIIADTSKATATRDLQHLHSIGAFQQIGSGRSIRYELRLNGGRSS